MNLSKIVKRFRVDKPGKFRLSSIDPGDTCGLDLDKDELKERMAKDVKRLSERQEMLYAQDRWSVLMIIQAMDAAGKDGIVEHVMSGVNPQGVEVHSFKAPTPQELDHDFLWRAAQRLPERGRIGIFNRSYYEETLVVRIHPEFLDKQKLPAGLAGKDVWKERFKSIRNFERHLVRNGTVVLKFFLHLSRDEQRARLLKRIDTREKRWKFTSADVEERAYWDDYMSAYENMLSATSTRHAPWFIIPADDKHIARASVAATLSGTIASLPLHLPLASSVEHRRLAQLRAKLLRT